MTFYYIDCYRFYAVVTIAGIYGFNLVVIRRVGGRCNHYGIPGKLFFKRCYFFRDFYFLQLIFGRKSSGTQQTEYIILGQLLFFPPIGQQYRQHQAGAGKGLFRFTALEFDYELVFNI